MKSTLKAPGSERLKLKCDDLLSKFAFNFNLRRYTKVAHVRAAHASHRTALALRAWRRAAAVEKGRCHTADVRAAGRGLHSLVPISAQLELFCPPYDPS